MTLNVSLPPELEARVRARVRSGLYGSASEVIREALRVFETYEAQRAELLRRLRDDIAVGEADAAGGRATALSGALGDDVKKRGRERLAAGRDASGERKTGRRGKPRS